MPEKSLYVPAAFTDDDWQLVVVALASSRSKRARELAQSFLDWRIACASSQLEFLRAFKALHKL